MKVPIQALALLLLLTSCVSREGGIGSPGESEGSGASSASSQSPGGAGTFSPTRASERPAQGESLTGSLGSDAIEGGCAYLQAADGTRFEVLYPDGWNLQMSPLQLIGPDGTVHARAGDLVTLQGAIAIDMASICQIGPIFRAAEVVAP